MNPQPFGSIIKDARKHSGLNQRELAEKIEIDYGYLSKIERGLVPPPSEKVILKLAEILSLDADTLFVSASRPPSDLDEVITDAPYIPGILRRTKGLNKEDWNLLDQLIDRLHAKKEQNRGTPSD